MNKTPCLHCGEEIELTSENCVAYVYLKQPWFSWVKFTCEECERVNGQFFGPNRWLQEIRDLAAAGVEAIVTDFPSETTVRQYEAIYDISPVKSYWLSPRRETELQRFAREIEFYEWLSERGLL